MTEATKEDTKPTRRQTRRQESFEAAQREHAEWIEDFGHGGDAISDIAYRAHLMKITRMAGEDENLVIAATQDRKQVGLDVLDVPRLLFSGKLKARVAQSKDEIADKTLENEEEARKALLKKKQRNGRF